MTPESTAREIAKQIVDAERLFGARPPSEASIPLWDVRELALAQVIATALTAAEARGRENGREEAARVADSHEYRWLDEAAHDQRTYGVAGSAAQYAGREAGKIAAAIRALGVGATGGA